jgi:peptidoglycan/xylan/chitin deacetylase (PgdA/CDA1 family)
MPAASRHTIACGRWYAKKLARGGLATATSAARVAWPFAQRPQVRVLTYHRFGDQWRDPFCISVREFAAQMQRVARRGAAVSLPQVRAFVAGAAVIPPGAVLVTIDDGSACLWHRALPILRAHGIPAVAFVPAEAIAVHGRDRETAAAADVLTIDQLAHLADFGITLGSHGWSHRPLAALAPAEIKDEVSRSHEALERWTGRQVDAFAYPYGRRGDFSAETERALRECGYACAFTSQHGAVLPGENAFALPRIKIEAGEPTWIFDLACTGGLDAWGLIDRVASRWQQHRPL